MSDLKQAEPRQPEDLDGMDGLGGTITVDPKSFGKKIWRFFISMKTGLVLMLLLGILTLIGTMLVQAPEGAVQDPATYASWLETIRPRYGGWTTVLNALGFFTMFQSVIFKLLLVMLTVSILACSMNRAPRLWRLATHPTTRMRDAFFEHAPLRDSVELETDPDTAREEARLMLRSHHYRTITPTDEGEDRSLYADKFRFGPFGTVIAHLSFVVIILGAFLSATGGFRDSELAVPVGSKVAVGHDTGLTVEATGFSDAYYPDGSPKDYASDINVYKDGQQVASQTVRVNQPLRVDGVTFYQSFFGTAEQIRVQDQTGKVVVDQGIPLVFGTQDGTHNIGQVPMPGTDTVVSVVAPASGEVDPNIRAGQVEVNVWPDAKASQPAATQVIDQGKPTEVGGYTVTFVRSVKFTGLTAANDPGATVVWIGSLGLVLGIFLVFFFPQRRIWVRVSKTATGSQIKLASMTRKDMMFEGQFHKLASEIKLTDTRSSATTGKQV
ncbi:MAG: cytochrome c biogenesis protein ResB [Actinomycetes bacterium]